MEFYQKNKKKILGLLIAMLCLSEFIEILHSHDAVNILFSIVHIIIIVSIISFYLLLNRNITMVGNKMSAVLEQELRKLNTQLETKVKVCTENLTKSEAKYRKIFENIQEVFFQTNLEGIISEVSPSVAHYTSFKREYLIGKNVSTIFYQEKDQKKFMKKLFKEKKIHDFELRLKSGENKTVWTSVSAQLMYHEKGKICGIEGLLHDITERKQREEDALKLTKAIAQSPATVVITDCSGVIEYVNPKFSEVTGYTYEEAIGQNPRILKTDKQPESFYKELWKTIMAGNIWRGEFCNKKKDGGLYWESASISPIRNIAGEITSFVAVKEDITEQKDNENKIQKLSQAVEQSPASVIMADQWGKIEYVNQYFLEYTGFRKKDIIGQELGFLHQRHTHDHFYVELWETMYNQDAWYGDLELKKKDGTSIWVNGSTAPIIDDQGQLLNVIGVFQDISQRKQIESDLKKERFLLQTLMDNIPDAIYFKDHECRFQRINQSLATFLNLDSPEQAVGKTDLDFFNDQHGNKTYEDDCAIIRTGKSMVGKIEENTLSSGLNRWISTTKVPVKNNNSEVVGIVGVSRDISHIKNFEKKLKQKNKKLKIAKQQAEEATRMKTEFLANMSHEIRTPMNAILGFSEILSRTVEDPVLKNHVKAINSSGKILLQLINDILDLSKIEAGRFELNYSSLNVEHLFKEMQQIFTFKAKEKDIDFRLSYDQNLPKALLLDEIRLRQILLNLIGNAVKFTSTGYVEISVYQKDEQSKKSRLSLCFEIKDTGIGIPKNQQKLIFDQFIQQTGQDHAQYGGTGLGLAITKRLVKMMGGTIEVESDAGNGSIFRVILNHVAVSSLHDLHDLDYSEASDITFNGGKVLVVDDIVSNRTLIQNFLAPSNLDIIHAENGKQAIEKALAIQPDIILMDIKMPVMNGYDATIAMKNDLELKHIPIIILTASVMQRDVKKIQDIGANGYLRKPISRLELSKKLAKFLDHTSVTYQPDFGQETETNDESDVFNEINKENLKKAIEIIEREQMPVWENVKNSVILSEIETFAADIVNVGKSMEVNTIQKWGQCLLQKVANFEMDSIPETISGFPEYITDMKVLLEDVTHV